MHKATVLPTSVFQVPVSYPRERTNQFLVYSARDIKCKYQHTDYICGVTLYAWLCTHLFFLYFGDFFHAALLFVMVASYFMYKWSIIYLISVVVVAYCSVDHCVHLFVSPGTAAHQASLTFTSSWSLLKHMSIVSVMPSNYLTLCHPLLLLPSIFPTSGSFQMSQLFTSGGQNIGVSTSTSVLPMNTQDWSLGWTGWICLLSEGLSRVFSNTAVQTHQFFGAQLSL